MVDKIFLCVYYTFWSILNIFKNKIIFTQNQVRHEPSEIFAPPPKWDMSHFLPDFFFRRPLSEPREQPPILVCGNSSDPPLKRTQGAATNPRVFSLVHPTPRLCEQGEQLPLLIQHCISAQKWTPQKITFRKCHFLKLLHKLFVCFIYITTMWCWSNILIGCLNCLFTPHHIREDAIKILH